MPNTAAIAATRQQPAQTGVRRFPVPQAAVLAVLVVVVLVLLWSSFSIVSSDYRSFLSNWYAHLAQAGGFAGLGDVFSNYNTPCLALLALLTYLAVDPLSGIKTIPVVFDLLLAFLAYRICGVSGPIRRGCRRSSPVSCCSCRPS